MIHDPRTLTKFISVQRSDRSPTLHWWSLPLPLRALATFAPEQLAGATAMVHPAAALANEGEKLGTTLLQGGRIALVSDIAALLAARDEGRIAACTIAVFPPASAASDVESRAAAIATDLERLPFTIAIRPDGRDAARHRFCFRVPGKVVAAIERLAHGRGFGGNAGQVEMALLQGLALRPKHSAHLQLVLHDGGARLVGIHAGGRRRVTLLESGKGYVGVSSELALADAMRQRVREAVRRFPVGILMFAGLPFFILSFWIATAVRRATAPDAVRHAPDRAG